MKKRVLSLLLVFVMVLGMLPVNAFAAELLTGYNFSLNADKDVIQAGESVTLTVELDKTIPVEAGATMIQFELWYDSTVVKETSMTNGPDYTHVPTGGAENDFGEIGKGVTTFGWCADDNEPVEFPAGTLATIVYTAVEDIEAESLETTFALELYVCDYISEDLVVATPEVTVTVEKPAEEPADPAESAEYVIKVNDAVMELVDGGIQSGCDSRYVSADVQLFNVTVPAGTTTVTVELKEGATATYANIQYMVESSDHAFGGNAMPTFEADVVNYDGLCINCGGKYYHVTFTVEEKAGAYQSITTDMEGDVLVTEQEMIEGWIPYYHAVVPRGSGYAYVTYPADTIYVYGGQALVVEYALDNSYSPQKQWPATENADGSVTVAVPITELLVEEIGTGYAVCFWKADGGEVLEGFTFSYAEDTTVFLVNLAAGNGYTTDGAGYVKNGEDYSFTVDIKNGYDATNMVVKVNGEVVTPDENGVYTVANVTADLVITVEGVEAIPTDGDVTFYFSVEEGDHFVEQGGVVWALEEVTVPYFDLATYGMEYLYYNPDCYSEGQASQAPGTKEQADGVVTMLHALIWLTEVYYNDLDPADAGQGWLYENGWPGFSVYSATAGSAFFHMWDFGYNFNYYMNYEYPLGYPGWGATCDQIKLSDGDVVSMRYNDNSGNVGTYHHFGEKALVTKTVNKGQSFDLDIYRTGEDYANYTTPVYLVGEGHNVYLFAKDEIETTPTSGTLMATTDENGKVTIDTSDLELGTYYLVSNSSSPAVMLLTVEAGEEPEPEYKSKYGITVMVGDEEMDLVADGTETCGVMQAQKLTVTVPAGTTEVTFLNITDTVVYGQMYIYSGAHDWTEYASNVTEATINLEECGTSFCISDSANNWYHVTISLPHEHSYEAVVTKPTCTEGGYTTYTCACGDSYIADETDALGHSYVAGVCTRCGEEDADYVAPTVTVNFSISDDANYLVGDATGEVMALKEITVPYFDLALYGLEGFYFSSETYGDDGDGQPGSALDPGTPEYADGKITLLHLYIYALEVYHCGLDEADAGKGYLYNEGLLGTEVLDVGGSQGSAFLNYIWGVDMNLNYYVNYEYPLASEGWGATCDQILLRDGDIMTLGHFTSWSFYSDPTSIFNYIVSDNDNPTQGDEITLTLYHAGADFSGNYTTAHTEIDYCPDVYYVLVDELSSGDVTEWTYLGAAEADGTLVVDTSELEAGEYIIAIAGQYGEDYPDEICSTPGGVILTVEACEHSEYSSVVTAPTCTEDGYTTYTCACGDSYIADETDALGHSYVAGVCTRCGEEDADYVAPTATIYMTVSRDYDFIEANGTPMALVEMTVPYFDIALYGLESIYYNPDCYANGAYGVQVGGTPETADGVVTMLHALIWATEVYYNGLSPEDAGKGWLANEGGWNGFSIGTNPGSAFMSFWEFGGNVNYYLNYEYPLGAPGWGATADQIALENGDVISMRYNGWTGNDGSYYHFGENGIISQTITEGREIALTLYSAVENYFDYTTGHTPVGEGEWVYVIPADDMIGEHWDVDTLIEYQTDANGSVTIADLEPGVYYITSETHDPAVMILVVEACEHSEYSSVVTAPTCTEDGYTTYTCKQCGHSYTDDKTDALGHTEVVDAAVAPTCTETGLTEGKHCSVCDEVLVAQEVVPANGHTDENKDYTCDTCGADLCTEHVEEVIPAVAPTCTTTGLTEGKKCSICGDILVAQTEVAALGHTWDEGKVTTDPTCTAEGVKTFTCTVEGCNGTKTEPVAALGHTWDEGKVTTEATCTTEGVKTYTCTICGETKTEAVAALGHTVDEKTWKHDGTNHWHECETCGEKLDTAKHSGGKATTEKKAVCDGCDAEYGALAPTTPQTGDNSMIGAFILLMVLSAAALVLLMVYRKRRMA